jgi:hypothetical protein
MRLKCLRSINNFVKFYSRLKMNFELDFNEFMIQNTTWHVPKKYVDLNSIGQGGFGAVW